MHPLVHAFLRQQAQTSPDYSAWEQVYRKSLYAYEISRQPPWQKQTLYDAWYRQEALLDLAAGFLPAHPERTLRLLLGSELALMGFVTELPALQTLLTTLDATRYSVKVVAVLTEARSRLAQFLADREIRYSRAASPLERGFAAALLGRWDVVRSVLASVSPDAHASPQAQPGVSKPPTH
jgi:hypothetical protein